MERSGCIGSLSKLLKDDLDFVLIHETPCFPEYQLIGNSEIRKAIENGPESAICCGHCYWEHTLVKFQNQSQVINVDSKVLLLKINRC